MSRCVTAIGRRWAVIWVPAVLLGACAAPGQLASERQAVAEIKEQKRDIPYNDDVAVRGNRAIFGFRSLPQRVEAPEVRVQAARPVAEVAQCLQNQLRTRFKLPEDFFQVGNYANQAQSVALVNPFTKRQGLMMDIEAVGVNSSIISLYANGATLSKAWRQLPARCAGAAARVETVAAAVENSAVARRSSGRARTEATSTRPVASTNRSSNAQNRHSAQASSRKAAKTKKAQAQAASSSKKAASKRTQAKPTAANSKPSAQGKTKANQGGNAGKGSKVAAKPVKKKSTQR